MRVRGILSAAVAFALLAPAPASAGGPARIHVFPGRNTINRAIDRADPGDILRIHRGRYDEIITVDKPLTLIAVGDDRVTIDGECAPTFTIAVRADNVTLDGLRVRGATYAEVDFSFQTGGKAKDLVVRDTCDAEYGINVYQSGPTLLIGNRTRGFSDAGLYVGAITFTGTGAVRVKANESLDNNRGAIIEDSIPGSVSVINNVIHDNTSQGFGSPTGIFLHRSDGITIRGNTVMNNGAYGIHLDPGSDGNLVTENTATGHSTFDLYDQGMANCWPNNTYGTSSPSPINTVC